MARLFGSYYFRRWSLINEHSAAHLDGRAQTHALLFQIVRRRKHSKGGLHQRHRDNNALCGSLSFLLLWGNNMASPELAKGVL